MNTLILARESYPVGFAVMSGGLGAILGSFLGVVAERVPGMVMDEENFSYLSAMVGSDEEKHKIHRLGDYFSHHPNHNIVPDPYYGGERGFELVLDLLEDACGGFLDSITAVLS